jgi:hypothetical protein
MKYQPFKKPLRIIISVVILTAAAGLAIFSEQGNSSAQHIPGSIVFSGPRPQIGPQSAAVSMGQRKSFAASFNPKDWFEERFEDLMSWDQNPWKRNRRNSIGEHYYSLCNSTDPKDRDKVLAIQRQAEAYLEQLCLRYPEMAVTMRTVPAEKNRFLKWLEFSEKWKKDHVQIANGLSLPPELKDYLDHKAPWNAAAARAWLAQQKPLLDEIRSIGLLPDASQNGIDMARWSFTPQRLPISVSQALMLEARLAAEEGNVSAAMQAIRAAKGLGDQFTQVESPTLMGGVVGILTQMSLEKTVLEQILPALPPGSVDAAAWEALLRPSVNSPADLSRMFRGDWRTTTATWLLPGIVDSEETRPLPDPGELLDTFSSPYTQLVRDAENTKLADLPSLQMSGNRDHSHLSYRSREVVYMLSVNGNAWLNGAKKSFSSSGMTQAAFAILKGQAIPNDPIYGQPYIWDPATRQLSPPATDAFKEMNIKPIKVPRL